MATYGFLDMFLGFSGLAFTIWGLVSLIFHWEALFQEVRNSCKENIAHPKRSRLLWLVSLTIATWFLAVVMYSRDVSAVWNMMKVLKVRAGKREFAFTITQTYFFVLLICGVLAFVFTGWFSYHNRREFSSLAKIIRFQAVRFDSDDGLENGRNDQREMDTAHSEEDHQAGWGYMDTESEDERDPVNCCLFCRDYHAPGWSCSDNEDEDQHDWCRSTNEGEDPHDWSRFTHEDEDQYDWSRSNNEGDALRLTPSSSGSDAEADTSTARPPAFDNWYAAPDDTESCSSCDSEYTRTIPWTRPAAHREPLTPTSPTAPIAPLASDADADADADADTEDTDDYSTSAQEQRRRSTGTAFSLPVFQLDVHARRLV